MSKFEVLTVHAKEEGGVKSGVAVKRDEVFTVSGNGRAYFDKTRATYPDGTMYIDGHYAGAYTHPEAVLPGAPIGALIARIGSGPWLSVGSSQTFRAQEAGEVIVAYNDRPKLYGDNTGDYSVMVENHGSI
jgi:hypothetical protein